MKTSLKHIFLLLFFALLHLHHAKAQIFPFWQYTTADELASSNVNDITQNEQGYLWFATDRGVSRFDGFKFNSYLYTEGLPFAKINSFAQNENRKVIASTPYKGVQVYGNNFTPFLTPSDLLPNDQSVDLKNHFFSLKQGEYLTLTDKQSQQTEKIKINAIPFAIIPDGNGVLVATDKGVASVSVSGELRFNQSITEPVYSLFSRNGILYAGGSGSIYIQYKDGNKQTIPLNRPGTVTNVHSSLKGDLWFTNGLDNNLYLYTTKNELRELSTGLQIKGAQINKIFEDHEGNIWLATTGKGAICIHHFFNINYTKTDGLANEYVTSLAGNEGQLYIGTRDGIYKMVKSAISPLNNTDGINVKQLDFTYSGLVVYADENVSATGREKIGLTGRLKFSPSLVMLEVNDLRAVIDALHHSKSKLDQLNRDYINAEDSMLVLAAVNDVYVDPQHTIWIATKGGLITSPPAATGTDTALLDVNISCILPGEKGAIFFGTENGLAKLEKGTWIFHRQIKGKNIEGITSLVADDKNRFWIGTLTGLYVWDKKSIIQFDTKNILPSDEINALYFDNHDQLIWAGTSSGLSCIDIAEFDATKIFAPLPIFKNLRTADSVYREFDLTNELVLPHDAGNFALRFSAIHFSSPEGVKFYYKFDDEDWQPATGRQIEFASIPYGKHTFLIKAVGERDAEGPPAIIHVTLQTPFWATTWFKIMSGVVITFLAYITIRKRFETIKKKQQEHLELQAKIAELRHQALAASMNPHFIFNALNSIQQFINMHNTEEASEYLGKFARLIRIMLNSGGKTFITLKEELERLHYYLDLEKIRFGEKLNYEIRVDESLQTEQVEIPNMVIQPIVENALWHGLLPANRNGFLKIAFSGSNGSLQVVVDDNGVGINESRKRKKSGHVSLGLQMIEERLALLKKLNGYSASISVKDKSDLTPPEEGTVVDVVLN